MKRIALILAATSIVFGQDAPRKMKNLTYEMVAPTIAVTGLAGTKATLTVVDLSKLPQQTVKATDHGTAVTFEGVLLSDLLAKVATPTGRKVPLDRGVVLRVGRRGGRIQGGLRLGGSRSGVHGPEGLRGDEAGWQAAGGKGRAVPIDRAR